MNKALPCLLAGLITLASLQDSGGSLRADGFKPAAGASQTYVVLVGISEYADKQIKPRPLAEADAKALYDLFKANGVDAKHMKLLLGKGKDGEAATRENFLKALKGVSEEAGANDTVVFAFIGQGGPLGDSGDRRCYFLSDSTFKGRNKDAVATEDIEEALKKFQSKRFCVFLDVDFHVVQD